MAEYRLAGGRTLTDEEIERLCERYERGDYSEFRGGEVYDALVSFPVDGVSVEGVVVALGNDGRSASVRGRDGVVHDGIPCSELRIVRPAWPPNPSRGRHAD